MIRLVRSISTTILLLILVMGICACGKSNVTTEGLSSGNEQPTEEMQSYKASFLDLCITPDIIPQVSCFQFVRDSFAFCESKEGVFKLYNGNVNNGKGEIVEIPFEKKGIQLIAYRDSRDTLFVLLRNSDGYSLVDYKYSQNTTGESMALDWLAEDNISRMAVTDETICMLSESKLYLVNSDLSLAKVFDCPGSHFNGYITAVGKKYFYSYTGADQSTRLAVLDIDSFRMTDISVVQGPGFISDDGKSVLYIDGDYLCRYEPDNGSAVKLCQFSTYNINKENIIDLTIDDEGSIRIISWELANQMRPVELIVLSSKDEGEGEERKIVYLSGMIDFDMQSRYGEAVADFNKKNSEYQVVIESVSSKDISLRDEENILNARIAAGDRVDLIAAYNYDAFQKYKEAQVLEDLLPYLQRSGINLEDMNERILGFYEDGNELLGLPIHFSVRSLGGKASLLGTNPAWTVGEFLQWLEEHPETKAANSLQKQDVLAYCLMGDLSEYVDFASGEADFDNESFAALLERIKKLHSDEDYHYDDWFLPMEEGEIRLEDVFIDFREAENLLAVQYGDDFVFKGFPGKDGEPVYFYGAATLHISKNSKNKDAAFEFLQFYYKWREERTEKEFPLSVKKFDAISEKLTEEHTLNQFIPGTSEVVTYQLSDERKQELRTLVGMVTISSYEQDIIRSIIAEETESYFAGQKDVSVVCEIIQNRVQVYLDEKK